MRGRGRKEWLLPATCLVVSLLSVFLDLRMLTTECSPWQPARGVRTEPQGLSHRHRPCSQRAAAVFPFPSAPIPWLSEGTVHLRHCQLKSEEPQPSPGAHHPPQLECLGFRQQKAGLQMASAARENLLKLTVATPQPRLPKDVMNPFFTVLGHWVHILLLWGSSPPRKRKPSEAQGAQLLLVI